jgi:penicillin-insensitive murein endopeptidase
MRRAFSSLGGLGPLVVALGLTGLTGLTGCARAPSPLAPLLTGSIGLPHRGVLTKPTELPAEGVGYRLLAPTNERHFGTARFVAAIERAAAKVAHERPGSTLTIGDLSARTGGKISSHSSHRSGRDADLLLYMTTLDGAPITSPGFVHVGTDGLAFDEAEKRFLRFDVEREWLLVKALVEDPEARVEWLFASKPVEAMLIDWARARGESGDTIVRAMDMLLQPGPPAQNHDDHVHVRIACDPDEIAAGCEDNGPVRPWLAALDATAASVASAASLHVEAPTTKELVELLIMPIDPAGPTLAGTPSDARTKNRD